jgi:hypothetical protein
MPFRKVSWLSVACLWMALGGGCSDEAAEGMAVQTSGGSAASADAGGGAGRAAGVAGSAMSLAGTHSSGGPGVGTGGELGAAFSAPFIVGTDVYVPAATSGWTKIDWSGTVLRTPNWPSNEGMQSVNLR